MSFIPPPEIFLAPAAGPPDDRHCATPIDRAATHLRTARGGGWTVWRCDAAGRQVRDGTFWRVGHMVLSPGAMMAMAVRKGFDDHAWQRISAPGTSNIRSKETA